jgi:hypothetical protein
MQSEGVKFEAAALHLTHPRADSGAEQCCARDGAVDRCLRGEEKVGRGGGVERVQSY